jgi:hypothetical protein
MVKVTVYGERKHHGTQQVMILLEELNLEYEFVDTEETGVPFCRGPAVKYGERLVHGPITMMRYISKANKGIEEDFYFSTDVDLWMEIAMNEFVSKAAKLIGGSGDQVVTELETTLDEYERHLEGKVDGLVDDRYSVVDMIHVPYVYELMKLGYKGMFKKRENVYNWLKKIMRRPATRHVLE